MIGRVRADGRRRPVSIRLAGDKAFTALVNRMPTADLAPIAQPGAELCGYDSVAGGRIVVFAGGMPLERDGLHCVRVPSPAH